MYSLSICQEMEWRVSLKYNLWILSMMVKVDEIIRIDYFIKICHLTFDPSQSRGDRLNKTIYYQLYLALIAAQVCDSHSSYRFLI